MGLTEPAFLVLTALVGAPRHGYGVPRPLEVIAVVGGGALAAVRAGRALPDPGSARSAWC
jgi:hypothetical protein